MSIQIILNNIHFSGNNELIQNYNTILHLQKNVKKIVNYDSDFIDLEKNYDATDPETFQRMKKFCQKYISFHLFLKGYDLALFNIPEKGKVSATLELETITTDHIFDTLFLIDETVGQVSKISDSIYATKLKNPETIVEKLHKKHMGKVAIDVENLCENKKFASYSYKHTPQIFDFYTYLMFEYFLIVFFGILGFVAFPEIQYMYHYFFSSSVTEFDYFIEVVCRLTYIFFITYCVDILLNGQSSLLIRSKLKF